MTKAKRRRNRMPSSLRHSTATLSDAMLGVFTSSEPDARKLETVEELHEYLESMPESNRGGLDIRGRVLAEEGIFNDERGQFDEQSLELVAELGNKAKKGLKSYFKHKSLSDDNLGRFLGRDHDLYVDDSGEKLKVRSSHFVLSSSAMKSPPEGGGTPYGEYVAELVITDPQALSSSLTLNYKPEESTETSEEGDAQPQIWRPTRLWSIDVVSQGAAVGDFLGFDEKGDEQLVAKASEFAEQFFDADEITPEVMRARLNNFVDKIVQSHFQDKEPMADDPKQSEGINELLEAQKETNGLLNKLIGGLAKKEQEPAPKADELSPADFAKKVSALCTAQGKPELINEFLSAELSLDEVKDKLLSATKKDRQLDDNPNDDQGAPQPKEDLEAKLQAEYDENREIHTKLGLTFEQFKKDRMIELGKEDETSPMLNPSIITSIATLIIAVGLVAMYSGYDAVLTLSSMGMVGMAVAADQLIKRGGGNSRRRIRVAGSDTLYNGTIVFMHNDGYAHSTYAASSSFAGIAVDNYANTGADGALEGETDFKGLVTLDGVSHSLTIANINAAIYATDNWTIGTSATSAVQIGTLADIDDDGNPVIDMG